MNQLGDQPVDCARVTKVLLADGWHIVDSASFSIGRYAFFEEIEGGAPKKVFAEGLGFSFYSSGQRYDGPMSSVLATVAYTGPKK